eukprot:SAG11_NODE_30212_length_303_cov_0.715686_1_plen_42_part_01
MRSTGKCVSFLYCVQLYTVYTFCVALRLVLAPRVFFCVEKIW